MTATCFHCRFWVSDAASADYGDLNVYPTPRRGECRRYPPAVSGPLPPAGVAAPLNLDPGGAAEAAPGRFPLTAWGDWCGEFLPSGR